MKNNDDKPRLMIDFVYTLLLEAACGEARVALTEQRPWGDNSVLFLDFHIR